MLTSSMMARVERLTREIGEPGPTATSLHSLRHATGSPPTSSPSSIEEARHDLIAVLNKRTEQNNAGDSFTKKSK